MTLTKFASAAVLDARIARQGAGLVKDAHRHEFEYEPRPGFLYVRSRAISSRTNDNFDHFPAAEIKKAYRTFVGKPVFVNHHNDNHRRARGVIVDAALHEDINPDGTEDTWAEVLMEVDAVNFPKLAQAILAGEIDRTSMGTDVQFSVCSVCNNKAETPLDYCQHIPKLKGKKVYRTTASGEKEAVLVYEKCYGLGFFENSLLVEEPADPTAYFLGVDARGLQTAASKTAERGDGWLINGKPYADGVWIEVEPDTWYRGSKDPEIPSRLVVKREGDKWAWQAQVLTFIGAPHEDTGWQKSGSPKGTARTLEQAQQKALNSLAKDHEFFQRYQDRQRAKMSATASKTADMAEIIGGDWADETSMDLLHRDGAAPWVHEDFDLLAGNAHSLGPQDRRAPLDYLLDPYTHTPVSGSKEARSSVSDFKVGDEVWYRRDEIGARSSIDAVIRKVEGDTVTVDVDGFVIDVSAEDLAKGRFTLKHREAARHTAIGETMAPAQVDTLRDEQCPVCGEADTFDGEKCLVCNFIKPPDEFLDPDLEKAKQVDLRQQADDAAEAAGAAPQDGAADPNQAPGADVEAGQGDAQPWLSRTRPAAGAEDPAAVEPAAGANPWEQKSKPKTPAGANPPGETSTGTEPWKARTRRKSARADTQKEQSMRPALAALAAQQKQIDALQGVVGFVVEAAGLTEHPRVASLMKAAADENPAQGVGWAVTSPEAQGSEAPAQTTEQALAPSQGKDDPENVGATPNTDVQPDAKTSLDADGTVLDVPLDLNEQDVTKPVAGTDTLGQGERGQADTNRTETDVRAGTPSDTGAAFAETGWTASKNTEGRQIASLRLARLRMQAGIESGDDLALASTIASSDATDDAIQTEIDTLAKVVQASKTASREQAPRHLVPRAASAAQRTVPSFVSEPQVPMQTVASAPSEAEFLFE